MSLVFLIGMPGAGKTLWGHKLALHYRLPFIDLDSLIEQETQQTIPEIFVQQGESGFRAVERDCLLKTIKIGEKNAIIACGGGAPCFFDNIEQMKTAGIVIFLEAGLEWLQRNLANSFSRPLLQSNQTHKLETLLQTRTPFYKQAHYILPAENLSLSTFDQIFELCIKEH